MLVARFHARRFFEDDRCRDADARVTQRGDRRASCSLQCGAIGDDQAGARCFRRRDEARKLCDGTALDGDRASHRCTAHRLVEYGVRVVLQ